MIKTEESTELLVKTLPVTQAHNQIWTPVLRVRLFNWKDLLEVTGNVEVTNDLGYNVSVVGKFYVAQNRDDKPASQGHKKASCGFEEWITKYANGGHNVTPNMHHGNIFLSDIYTPPKQWTRNVIYAIRATSDASKPGQTIQVDGGKIYVKIFEK